MRDHATSAALHMRPTDTAAPACYPRKPVEAISGPARTTRQMLNDAKTPLYALRLRRARLPGWIALRARHHRERSSLIHDLRAVTCRLLAGSPFKE